MKFFLLLKLFGRTGASRSGDDFCLYFYSLLWKLLHTGASTHGTREVFLSGTTLCILLWLLVVLNGHETGSHGGRRLLVGECVGLLVCATRQGGAWNQVSKLMSGLREDVGVWTPTR